MQDDVAVATKAVMAMVAGGSSASGMTVLPPAPEKHPLRPRPAEPPGFAIPGMAGTFRRPLAETVHAQPGGFEGGAFGRGSKVVQETFGPGDPESKE